MLALLHLARPYLLAAAIGASLAWSVKSLIAGRILAHERAAHARDSAQYAKTLKAISDASLTAQRKAERDRQTAEKKIEALDAQLTKEQQTHEADNLDYRTPLAAGTERLRIAVTHCAADDAAGVRGAAGTAGVDDEGATYADLDPAVAGRVFRVAGDDQREIDKLRALQAYVCAIRPETAGCEAR
jgi:prophage endopeptidase